MKKIQLAIENIKSAWVEVINGRMSKDEFDNISKVNETIVDDMWIKNEISGDERSEFYLSLRNFIQTAKSDEDIEWDKILYQ